MRVGIAWSGNKAMRGDSRRSMRLRQLEPLFVLPGVDFVSLQVDADSDDIEVLRQFPKIMHPAAGWEETTAIVSLLDPVITIDTSFGHLAGAMGMPVWIMLQHASDHRWLADREDTPWYPTARLFRQPRAGDWDSVIERIRGELITKLANRPHTST